MICAYCADTGSRSKSIDGHLDCIFCDVAIRRTRLEQWLRAQRIDVHPTDAWRIYQHGVFAAADALQAA